MFQSFITDINRINMRGRTLLFTAAEFNNPSKVKQYLSQGTYVNIEDYEGVTPLHHTAIKNVDASHFEVAEMLLKKGANVHVRDYRDGTPLWYLVQNCNVKMVHLFLNYGAEINEVDMEERNLLFSAVRYNKNVETLQLLIDLGLDINRPGRNGKTVLHWACIRESYDHQIVKFLLKNGACINAVDSLGYTPLLQAVRVFSSNSLDHASTIKNDLNFLIEHTDSNINHKNCNIFTIKIRHDSDSFVKLFIQHFTKLLMLDLPVNFAVLAKILQKDRYTEYYDQCDEELLRAKNIRFKSSWITLFNILVDNRKQLKNYAGNADLIKDFKNTDCLTNFPIYGAAMNNNIRKAIRRRHLFDTSSLALSNCLPIFNPSHLIIYDIFNCILSKKDLSKFCGEN